MTKQPDFRKLLEEASLGELEIVRAGTFTTRVKVYSREAGAYLTDVIAQDHAAIIVAAVNALPAHLARIAELEGVLSLCADQFRVLGRLANGGQIHRIEEGGKRVRMSLSKAVSSECEISEARVRAALSGGKP